MSAEPAAKGRDRAPSMPPAAKPVEAVRRPQLITEIELEHGPIDLLGRFFLKADTAARNRDVRLSFAPLEELIEVNRRNPETWRPILPLFDPVSGGIDAENAFCILGHNAKGDVVATQAARLYHWQGTSFHEEAESLRLFYADPERSKAEHEAIEVTAPDAKKLTGAVIFAGGIWYRPDYRGRQLANILPWLSRAYAYTRWQHQFSCSIMAEEVHKRGMAERSGYSKADWSVILKRTPVDPKGDIRCALVWMDDDELLAGVERFLATFDAQVDGGVGERRRQQHG